MSETDRRIAGVQGLTFLGIGPVPDGTISTADRRTIAGFFTPGGAEESAETSSLTASSMTGSSGQALLAMRRRRRSNRYKVSTR